jgi:hypothetical protein
MLLCSAALGLFGPPPVCGQPASKRAWPSFTAWYVPVDRHALQAPKSAEGSVAELAAYLSSAHKPDALKVRAIYRWMTDRIGFHPEGGEAEKPGDVTPEKVLQARLATAEGYAVLFKALCAEAKIEAKLIRGYAKTPDGKPGEPLKSNHVWNAVRLDGQWHLVDVARSAGEIKAKKWQKSFQPYYFFTPPERLVFSHFPEKTKDQLVLVPVKEATFRQRLVVPDGFVRYHFDLKKLQDTLDDPKFRGFASISWASWDPNFPLRLLQAPVEKHLKKGKGYDFRFSVPGSTKCYITGLGGEVGRNGGEYFANVYPKATGRLVLVAQVAGKLVTILEYEVEE